MSNTFYYYRSKDDLLHYGVLGMKWGVRRYQNEDGSLTSAGKKRYNYNLEKDVARMNLAGRSKEAMSLYKSARPEATDDEIKKAVHDATSDRVKAKALGSLALAIFAGIGLIGAGVYKSGMLDKPVNTLRNNIEGQKFTKEALDKYAGINVDTLSDEVLDRAFDSYDIYKLE